MKFKKLTIKNIASIRDAEIDFTSYPLGNSDVFLISGRTGSGKSTILDCISLALFGNVSRLNDVSNGNLKVPGSDEVTRKDVRQFMRRKTGEASASLLFTGNDGVDYEAVWSVTRSRRKPAGKLQKAERSLRNCKSGEVLVKSSDVKAMIVNVIGMDFEQFNRTTMLAQGEFTKFLKADDDTKGKILSKLTGIDIYRRIGAKTFEIFKEKKQAYDNAAYMLDERRKDLLDEQTEAAYIADVNALAVQIENRQKDISGEEARLGWLATDVRLKTELNEANKKLDEALKALETEEFRHEDAVVAMWDKSVDARQWLKESRKLKDEEKDTASMLRAKGEECGKLTNNLAWEIECVASLKKEHLEIGQYLAQYQDREEVYSRAAQISESVAVMMLDKKDVSEKEAEKKRLDAAHNAANVKMQKISESLKVAEAAEETARKAWSESNGRFEKLSIDKLREDHRRLHERQNVLANLRRDLERHLECVEIRRKLETDVRKREEAVEKLDRNIDVLSVEKKNADEALRREEECYKKQSKSFDDWAKEARAGLHEGDTCPLCGQVIVHLEQAEAAMLAMVENQKKKVEALSAQALEKQNKLSEAIALRDAEKKLTAESERTLKAGQADFDKKATVLHEALKTVGIDERGAEAMGRITELLIALDVDIATGDTRLKAAEELDKEVRELKKQLDKVLANHVDLDRQTSGLRTEIAGIEASAKAAEQVIATKNNDYADRLADIEAAVGSFLWKVAPSDDPVKFGTMLRNEAAEYDDRKKRFSSVGDEIAKKTELCETVEKDLRRVSLLLGEDFAPVVSVLLSENRRLESSCAALLESVVSLRDKSRERSQEIKNLDEKVSAFIAGNPGCDFDSLQAIDSLGADAISRLKSKVESLRRMVQQADAVLKAKSEEIGRHSAGNPGIGEGETPDTLGSRIAGLKEEVNARIAEQAAKADRLKKNDKLRGLLGEELKKVEALKDEWRRWARLNNLIGDADGGKFQSRAQIYLLKNLIRTANHYMKRLSDRYSLRVEPNAFDIFVVDSCQGGEIRSTSTISGGESFLVSLALALALSGVGSNISADTLFIDEGFGTLSGEALEKAIETLRTLQTQSGRHVGIISHVQELCEKIPVQILLTPEAGGSASTVTISDRPGMS